MANKTLPVTLLMRNALAATWRTRNPILQSGEWGLETDTFLLKIGDGVREWINLPYVNKLDSEYFKKESDGTLTFSDEFVNIINALQAAAGQAIENLQITDPPEGPYDVPNKQYVDDAIAAAGHLKRAIVLTLPAANVADPNTLYMVPASSGDHYEEYMVIDGVWDMVGSTGDGGSGGFTLEIATDARLGGVKSSALADHIAVDPNTGFMTLNDVSTSLLYIPTGDTLTLYGGSA